MKIPVILAQQGINVAAEPRASGAALALPSQALQQVGDLGTRLAAQVGAVEQKKYNQGVVIESNALNTQMETNAKLAIEDLKVTETDPDGYLQKSRTAITDAYKATSELAKYPETKAHLAQQLLHLQSTVGVDAARHSNQLYIDRNEGLLETNLAELRRMGATAPAQPAASEFGPGEAPGMYMRPKGVVDYFREGRAAIMDATPILGEKKRNAKLEKWTQDYIYSRAETALRADASTDISRYSGALNPESYDRLLARQDSLMRQQTAAYDRDQAKLAKDSEEARQYKLAQLSQLFTTGRGSQSLVDQSLQIGLIKTPTELEHYQKLLTEKPVTPSDQAVLSDLTAKVFHPMSTSVGLIPEIQRAMTAHLDGGKGLNAVDGRTLLGHLSGAITSADKEAYSIAKEEGLRALGITTPMSQLSKTEAKLVSEFERQFNAVARPANPNGEAPRDVLYKILPAFQSRQSSEARLNYEDQRGVVRGLVGTDVPDSMDPKFLAWYSEQAKQAEALIQNPVTASQGRLRKEQLLNLSEQRRLVIQSEARRTSGGSTSTPGSSGRNVGGYTPPKAP